MRELTTDEFQQAKEWFKKNIIGREIDTTGLDDLSLYELKHRAARYDALMDGLFPLPQEDEDEVPKKKTGKKKGKKKKK